MTDSFIEPDDLQADDFIQASRRDVDEPVEVAEGTVVASAGGTVTMGTRTYNAADGWKFELIRRVLTLPSSVSEIDATLYSAAGTHRLMGRGTIWSLVTDGRTVPADDIKTFELVE